MSDYEAVHTITDWYDGARGGIADLNGKPHYYENRWPEGAEDWSEIYFLQPIDDETFALAMEDWEIWLLGDVLSRTAKQLRKHIQLCPTIGKDTTRSTKY